MNINVFNIQHFSNGDGPGIRTTVFLHGCNLRCPWCHNPESLYGTPNFRNIDDVVSEVLDDMEFYDMSGGGVTISGGEPLCSPDVCLELLEEFKKNGLHTIIDTALAVKCDKLEQIAALGDMFFVDLKTPFADKFAEVCRGDFTVYKENLDKLMSLGAEVVIRIPLIPDFNMDDASIDGMIDFVKSYGFSITLLPFHRLGSSKYTELGLEYKYSDTEPLPTYVIDSLKSRFADAGIKTAKV
ncbi:MAG: radical SAM protein [Ruminococcaceae bacterium]|nr:radical SAM protein [Oscillospiraceae bacterium]